MNRHPSLESLRRQAGEPESRNATAPAEGHGAAVAAWTLVLGAAVGAALLAVLFGR
ncbi:MAG TPA: hypothetical protein PK313_11120 [Myxococcota bacterium]|nr:hypothetical protein [Myxococcota bacterium]